MNITMENFKTAKYDVFSIFDDSWGLCTAGTPKEYNTMTIGWDTMGTILEFWDRSREMMCRIRSV